jgi:hypothetical protein
MGQSYLVCSYKLNTVALLFLLIFCFLFSDARFPVHSGTVLIVLLSYSRWGDGKSTTVPNFIFAGESALAGIAAAVAACRALHKKAKSPKRQFGNRSSAFYTTNHPPLQEAIPKLAVWGISLFVHSHGPATSHVKTSIIRS